MLDCFGVFFKSISDYLHLSRSGVGQKLSFLFMKTLHRQVVQVHAVFRKRLEGA